MHSGTLSYISNINKQIINLYFHLVWYVDFYPVDDGFVLSLK